MSEILKATASVWSSIVAVVLVFCVSYTFVSILKRVFPRQKNTVDLSFQDAQPRADGERTIRDVYKYFLDVATGNPEVMEQPISFEFKDEKLVLAGYHIHTDKDDKMSIQLLLV